MKVFLNGKFVVARKAKISVFDHGFLYGDGVYETLRTYGGKVWQIPLHLRRLQKSAAMIGIRLPWSLSQLRDWILLTVKKNGFRESRIRLTVTRGENGFDFGAAQKPSLCIQVQKLIAPKAGQYADGVDVVTFHAERFLSGAKTLNLLPMAMGIRFMNTRRAYEALFVDAHGFVREGTVTTVFAVRGGVLMTPGKNVLPGTTRDVVLDLARRLGVKVRVADIPLKDLYGADEVFITNAPRGIVPVRTVDGRKVGKGCPGPVTSLLSKAFREKIRRFVLRNG